MEAAQLRSQLSQCELDLHVAKQTCDDLRAQMQTREGELTAAHDEQATLQMRLVSARDDIEQLNARHVAELQQCQKRAQAEMEAAAARLEQRMSEERTEQARGQAQARRQWQGQLEALEQIVADLKQQLADQAEAHQQRIKQLNSEYKQLESSKQRLETDLERVGQELQTQQDLSVQIKQAHARALDQLRQENAEQLAVMENERLEVVRLKF